MARGGQVPDLFRDRAAVAQDFQMRRQLIVPEPLTCGRAPGRNDLPPDERRSAREPDACGLPEPRSAVRDKRIRYIFQKTVLADFHIDLAARLPFGCTAAINPRRSSGRDLR